jgi:peptidoglycan-associated lipoprotein
MVRNIKLVVSSLVFALALGFAGCTQDEKKVDEVVGSDKADSPGSVDDSSKAPSSSTVYFLFDDYTLTSGAQDQLSRFAEELKANKSAVVQIEGHCDERGSIEYNLALGERRAQSVKNYLAQLGVESSRLSTISYGEEKPAVEGHDESAWAKNRRAEFVVSSK